jgi:hypothetical protein
MNVSGFELGTTRATSDPASSSMRTTAPVVATVARPPRSSVQWEWRACSMATSSVVASTRDPAAKALPSSAASSRAGAFVDAIGVRPPAATQPTASESPAAAKMRPARTARDGGSATSGMRGSSSRRASMRSQSSSGEASVRASRSTLPRARSVMFGSLFTQAPCGVLPPGFGADSRAPRARRQSPRAQVLLAASRALRDARRTDACER